MSDDVVVRLRLGEQVFEVEKSNLLRVENTYFHGMLSGPWQPDADGSYFVDRPSVGFDRILEYLSSGTLSVAGLNYVEEESVYSSLEYFLIPYNRPAKYSTHSWIRGFEAFYVCELNDGRLCGARMNNIIVWNMDTSAIEITLVGHTNHVLQVIQLQDGRVCSCSYDDTIKLWSIDSGLCELTLTGHTRFVGCVVQLFDGRICSGSAGDATVRVWNLSTGVCEMTLRSSYLCFSIGICIYCIAQLADGRIFCGDYGGAISIYSSLTGKCELLWKGHTECVRVIVCIDVTRICSSSDDRTIKVWSTATGECERTLEGHTDEVTSMVLMQDGKLCSVGDYGALILWNLETGECEKTIEVSNGLSRRCLQVLQVHDGRLVCTLEMYYVILVC